MRVALDGTPLSVPVGGIRRYTIELQRALSADYPGDDYRLFSDQLDAPRSWLARRWWMFGLNQELGRWGADLFHGTDFAVPYTRSRPSVMTVHDLSPWLDPDTSSRVRRRAPLLMRHIATLIVTPSEAVRRSAIERFGLEPDRVVAIPLAADHLPLVDRQRQSQPYLVYVGTLERRKNIERIVEARRALHVPLVLAGRARPGFAVPEEPGIQVLGEVRDEDLPALYSGALACLYPSLYEGFGLPVLEAMQCGTPVIASTDPAIREIAGDAALLLDPQDGKAWAEALRNAVCNPAWREDMSARGRSRARQYSWKLTAQLTHEAYEEALRRHGR